MLSVVHLINPLGFELLDGVAHASESREMSREMWIRTSPKLSGRSVIH